MDAPKFEMIGEKATLATEEPGQWLASDRVVVLDDWQ
jgi:hypothetical protein